MPRVSVPIQDRLALHAKEAALLLSLTEAEFVVWAQSQDLAPLPGLGRYLRSAIEDALHSAHGNAKEGRVLASLPQDQQESLLGLRLDADGSRTRRRKKSRAA